MRMKAGKDLKEKIRLNYNKFGISNGQAAIITVKPGEIWQNILIESRFLLCSIDWSEFKL